MEIVGINDGLDEGSWDGCSEGISLCSSQMRTNWEGAALGIDEGSPLGCVLGIELTDGAELMLGI